MKRVLFYVNKTLDRAELARSPCRASPTLPHTSLSGRSLALPCPRRRPRPYPYMPTDLPAYTRSFRAAHMRSFRVAYALASACGLAPTHLQSHLHRPIYGLAITDLRYPHIRTCTLAFMDLQLGSYNAPQTSQKAHTLLCIRTWFYMTLQCF